MKRLIEKGLIFGNLIPVTSPVWVERYNRALKMITGKTTALQDFHVDLSGYSPEIGDELGDTLYLNPNGVNRQFILLSPAQKSAPLLGATFSTSRDILRKFITANEPALFALTARDAVMGELVNSIYAANRIEDLLALRQIRIEADTTQGTIATADDLARMIDEFRSRDGAWHDDVLIGQMIGLARETGDIMRDPVALKQLAFTQTDFWTSHFGGLYVFAGTDPTAVVAVDPAQITAPLPVDHVIALSDREAVAQFLSVAGLMTPIIQARGPRASAILRRKMDFILVDAAVAMGESPGQDPRALRAFARRHAKALPEAWHGLASLVRWSEEGGPWPRIDAGHQAFFHTLRASDTPQAALVNQLLAELAPDDVLQLFICHKQAFYAAYATWPEAKREYVANFLESEYKADKAGMRAHLFGHEDAPVPTLSEDLTPPVPRGPWG